MRVGSWIDTSRNGRPGSGSGTGSVPCTRWRSDAREAEPTRRSCRNGYGRWGLDGAPTRRMVASDDRIGSIRRTCPKGKDLVLGNPPKHPPRVDKAPPASMDVGRPFPNRPRGPSSSCPFPILDRLGGSRKATCIVPSIARQEPFRWPSPRCVPIASQAPIHRGGRSRCLATRRGRPPSRTLNPNPTRPRRCPRGVGFGGHPVRSRSDPHDFPFETSRTPFRKGGEKEAKGNGHQKGW